MKYEEAVAIRSQQLQGKPVDQMRLLEALDVIHAEGAWRTSSQERADDYAVVVPRRSKQDRVMELLEDGPVDKNVLAERVRAIYDEEGKSVHACKMMLARLVEDGLISYRAELTDKGRARLRSLT